MVNRASHPLKVDTLKDIPLKTVAVFNGANEKVNHLAAITINAMQFGKVVFKDVPVAQ